MKIQALVTATVSGVLDALVPPFEQASGHTIERWDATAGQVRDRLASGAPADVAFVTSSVMADVEKTGRLLLSTRVPLAHAKLGIAIKAGAYRPELTSIDDLKRLILAAKTIALTDPSGGGNTGRYFMALADRLGLGAELKARSRLYRHGGHVSEGVAAGEADFGVTVISEIVPIAGAEVGGTLPDEVQNISTTYAALVDSSIHRDAGLALIRHLTAPASHAVIRAMGMEPGSPPPRA